MAAKFVIIFAALCMIACALAQSNHYISGSIQAGDRQLFKSDEKKSSAILQIVTRDVPFPPKGIPNNATINYIACLDQKTNGKGGYVSLLTGGVGYKEVTLHLKSQRGEGFHFICELWGR